MGRYINRTLKSTSLCGSMSYDVQIIKIGLPVRPVHVIMWPKKRLRLLLQPFYGSLEFIRDYPGEAGTRKVKPKPIQISCSKRQRKKHYSGKLAIRPDHPRGPIKIPFGMVGNLPAVVISFKFHQHRLSSCIAVKGWYLADFGCYYLGQLLMQHTTMIIFHVLFLAVCILCWTTRVSHYQKGKTNLDLLEQDLVRASGINWAICKSAPPPD